MASFKKTMKYYFTVEGKTEQWYLDWLQDKINCDNSAKYKIKIDSKIEKNPLKRARDINILSPIKITHVFDIESLEEVHQDQLKNTLDALKAATKLGKQIKYNLGCSNFTFELWIILHKQDCNTLFTHRKQYIKPINKVFGENFENLDQYKNEANFKRILRNLSLEDVKDAINRSKNIMGKNEENGLVLQRHKGYSYYLENPSLSVWESIEAILRDCSLL